jgi:hypothetical protein
MSGGADVRPKRAKREAEETLKTACFALAKADRPGNPRSAHLRKLRCSRGGEFRFRGGAAPKYDDDD